MASLITSSTSERGGVRIRIECPRVASLKFDYLGELSAGRGVGEPFRARSPCRELMTPTNISERDRAEIERSAAEAAKIALVPVEVDRYLNPPANTPYGLEYAFFLLGDVEGKTVLDLGCGTGENLIPLVKRGARVIAMDISSELAALAWR